jgi:hypothetical protein
LLELLESAACYHGDQRWSLLYEVLWRVSHGDRTAMLAGDKLGSELQRRIKQVNREAHHLHAFVRFIALPAEARPAPNTWPGMSRPTTFSRAPASTLSGAWAGIAG